MESTETLGSEQMGTDRDPGDQKHPTTSQQPRDSKMQLAKVLLPDGVQKEFEVNKNSEGEALFRQVTRDLSIEEREYFSLCFYDKDEGTRHWLYNDKNIAKQIKGLPWEFSFEVKFYPTTPTTIVDDHARYYVFLQLRRDLLTGRLPATADTHSLLGSFVAQIEFGDAPAEMTDAYEQFIVASKLVPSAQANPETYKKIVDLHREMRGQTPSEAENQFLDHCKHLALYGIHLFKAISDKDKKPVDVGIGAAGINIYQDEQKTHSFSWQNIIKIGYRRTYFSIKLKAGTVEKNEKTLYFKLPNHVAAKRTWKCAVEHHTFFRLIQPEDKTHKSFFNFGSQRFRYQGRTQFQTKIASQMFDKPSTVDRAPSAMSQPIATAENQKLQTLNLTDSELEQRQFERDKSNKKDKKKRKKGENETSGETSDSEHDEKREFAIVEFEPHAPTSPHEDQLPPKKPEHRTHKSPGRRVDEPMNEVTVVVTSSERPKELKNTKEVRHETREQQFRLTGDGYTSGFNPNDPSLMATIQRAERLNASSPRLEHAERTFTVRANAPLPVSFEESGQPYTTVSTWQETSDLPEQVEVYTDENGRQITRTVKSSQVKHTVQTQSFQNYIVDGDQVPVGVVDVERSREQLTPLGQKASSSTSSDVQNGGGENGGIVETQTRTMTYEAQGGENSAPPGWAEEGLGEYVSSKSVTQGNRTIETITYKTEKDGIVETHVEHRVTIHSDGDIDHDAELSQAILEATQMNPDMVVEKIEVRQETTQ